jgi:hypothetical protein
MIAKHLPAKKSDPWKEIRALHKRLENAKEPDPQDVDRLRQLLVETPNALSIARSTSQGIRHQLIEKISHGPSRAYLLAEVDKLKKELCHSDDAPLERLLIDHILTVRLRLTHIENAYNQNMVNQLASFRSGIFWDTLLTTTQARFLRAIETLARVRRLARNTPALQINIAREGGKQVNVQGDVNRQ